MLEDFKTDLGIFDKERDGQLQRLLDKATIDIINFTHQSKAYCEKNLSEQIIDLATIKFNRKGSEGLTSQSNSGSSESYSSDIPLPIQRTLVAHRKPVWK